MTYMKWAARPEGMSFAFFGGRGIKKRHMPDPFDWTGEPDLVAAAALAIALLVGAAGFLLIGAAVGN